MVTSTQVRWRGMSGQVYSYSVHPVDENWYDGPGNYIFAKYIQGSGWIAIYIGETSSLKDRLSPFSGHEKADCAYRNGITHIHAHRSSDQQEVRRTEEADLIGYYKPVCNG